MFGEIAKQYGFERAYEGWFKEFPEVIQVLGLQKSNYSNLYYLNIKIFIQGFFGKQYKKSKLLVTNATASIFCRPGIQYSKFLDLENSLEYDDRKKGIELLFKDFIVPFFSNTSSKNDIIKFYKNDSFFILPAVKAELGIQ